MRSAVFITPESLFSAPRAAKSNDLQSGAPVFRLAATAIRALKRLKDAGFMIIGVAGDEFFNGFASPRSCREFLSATALDDMIISHEDTRRDSCRSAVIQAAGKWLVDLDRSFIIGSSDDITAAGLTGCTPLKIGKPAGAPPRRPFTLKNAVERILACEPPPTPLTRV